ncbi:NupC/NupG family nucleoside CNT transporter [uncultured Clostridium sp.]|jgi:CNT family concentrative nucleoside transporter|uniref:NupC/NupG family nucleoside CNT transporter n=1 Tax=uncultured Clostridium sp. TaxID=59620 RepID=UPI002619821D|nr:nucleoside transporter C-terminal domain-containing protein [uncultured Clostridium sp.]
MEKIFAILGICLCIFITWTCSKNKKEINWKSVGCAFLGQIVLAFLMIKTPLWKVIELLSNGVTWVLNQATAGIDFVFGGIVPTGGFVFFINSLLPIIFISALVGILFHFGILQKFIGAIGNTVARLLRVDTVIAVNGVGNMFLGQTESLFLTKQLLPTASESVIFATLVGGMTSISASVVGLYTSYGADITWILVSMPLTVFSTFTLTQILMPTKYKKDCKVEIETTDKGVNVIETMMNYAMAGFKSVIGITIALIVFLSLIALINNLIGSVTNGITLQSILGVLFTPFAILMGVPSGEVAQVSQILATKLITNEAVAFSLPQFAMLSANAKAMMTTVLCGFAGIGSIGILIGGYSAVAPNRVGVVARLGIKALIVATVVNMLTGAIVGLML